MVLTFLVALNLEQSIEQINNNKILTFLYDKNILLDSYECVNILNKK